MDVVWNRIESWLGANAPQLLETLQPGAGDEEIHDAEARLGVEFPDDVKASYRIHDGQQSDSDWLFEAGELLSLTEVVDQWNVWKDLLDDGSFEDTESEPSGPIRNDWWNPKWIPLTYDGSGNHYCLDLDPAPGGKSGQIITMWHDDPERIVVAESFVAWFGAFAGELEAGEHDYSEDGG